MRWCADNAVARPGGHVLVSARDYEQARRVHPSVTPPQVWRVDGSVSVTFQVWDWWPDGQRYDLQHFHLAEAGGGWAVTRRTSCLWAVSRQELTECAELAGLTHVEWLPALDSGFFQPLLIARTPT